MGEYQAVLELSTAARDAITPLIEVPEIGFDFEKQKELKPIDAHLKPFAKRVRKKWGDRPCFVDVLRLPKDKRMVDGRHPLDFVFDELRSAGCSAVPVTGIARDSQYQRSVGRTVSRDGRGLCLRVTIEESASADLLKKSIPSLLRTLKVELTDCDFVLDLGAPENFKPVDGFAKLVEALIRSIPKLALWRTFTLLGTSFPSTMAEIEKGTTTIERWEWILYKELTSSLRQSGLRLPTFGDYAINHPEVHSLDMRLVKPAATIRYTTDDGWLIVKGPNVRDNQFGQYRKHCRAVLRSPAYQGTRSSKGDRYISDCAAGRASTGNLTTWRKVGTNRHLEKVVQDVSSLFGASAAL